MNKTQKRIATESTIFILGVLVIGLVVIFSNTNESDIKSAIEKANYCEIDSDCIDAGGKCPFGCYNYVNKNEVNQISKLLKSYNSKCIYGCVSPPTAICENNKCKEVYE